MQEHNHNVPELAFFRRHFRLSSLPTTTTDIHKQTLWASQFALKRVLPTHQDLGRRMHVSSVKGSDRSPKCKNIITICQTWHSSDGTSDSHPCPRAPIYIRKEALSLSKISTTMSEKVPRVFTIRVHKQCCVVFSNSWQRRSRKRTGRIDLEYRFCSCHCLQCLLYMFAMPWEWTMAKSKSTSVLYFSTIGTHLFSTEISYYSKFWSRCHQKAPKNPSTSHQQ